MANITQEQINSVLEKYPDLQIDYASIDSNPEARQRFQEALTQLSELAFGDVRYPALLAFAVSRNVPERLIRKSKIANVETAV